MLHLSMMNSVEALFMFRVDSCVATFRLLSGRALGSVSQEFMFMFMFINCFFSKRVSGLLTTKCDAFKGNSPKVC